MSLRRIDCPECGQSIELPPADPTPPEGPRTEAIAPAADRSPSQPGPLDVTLDAPSDGPARTAKGDTGTLPTAVVGLDRERIQIAGYEVLSELGRGGMGVVYLAKQRAVNRLVALKMILAAEHAGSNDVARFRSEAEAVAQLDHPNIVHIFEVGEHNGRPFFTLEYVDGGSLEQQLDGSPQPPHQAATLIETLARAVQHAHEHGIIHRDLKPANVLLTGGRLPPSPPASGREGLGVRGVEAARTPSPPTPLPRSGGEGRREPKITDFGLAKQLDSLKGHTQSGAILGTPSYMAPEQAASKRKEIGPACDVYALGSILYEMLTGRPPFKAETPVDTIMQVVSQEPVAPKRLAPGVPSDLETICLKCLQKEPKKRYASAHDLAGDLRRFLDGEPIVARPAGWFERAVKWTKRRPAVAALSAAIVLVTVGAFIIVSAALLDNVQQRQIAVTGQQELATVVNQLLTSQEDLTKAKADALQRAKEAEANSYFSGVALAYQLWKSGDVARARQALEACPTAHRGWEWHHLRREFYSDGASFPTRAAVLACAVSSDGKYIACITADEKLRVVEANGGRQIVEESLGHLTVSRVQIAFHPSGTRLAWPDGPAVNQCEIPSGRVQRGVVHKGAAFGCVHYTSEGRLLAAATLEQPNNAGATEVWDMDKEMRLGATKGVREPTQVGRRPRALALSPDGNRTAVLMGGAENQALMIWDVSADRLEANIPVTESLMNGLVFSPDGKRLAWGNGSVVHEVSLGPPMSGNPPRPLTAHTQDVAGLAYSPDGRFLASVGEDRFVRVWDVQAGMERFTLRGHADSAFAVAFGGNDHIVSGGGNYVTAKGDIKLWPTLATLQNDSYLGPANQIALCATLGLDARRFVQLNLGHGPGKEPLQTVAVRDRATNREVFSIPKHKDVIPLFNAFDPTGRYLAVAGHDVVLLLDADTGKVQASLPCPGMSDGSLATGRLAFSADGTKLVAARVPEPRRTAKGEPAEPRRLVITLFDVATKMSEKEMEAQLPGQGSARDTRPPLVLGLALKGLQKWAPGLRFGKGQPAVVAVTSVALRPDGSQVGVSVAAATQLDLSTDMTIHGLGFVFDCAGGRHWPAFSCDHILYDIAFRPNSPEVVTVGGKMTLGEATLWTIGDNKPVRVFRGHTRNMAAAIFTPDGSRLITAGIDNALKMWDPDTGREVLSLDGHGRPPTALIFTRDGNALISATGVDFLDLFLSIGVTPSSMRRPVEIRVWRTK